MIIIETEDFKKDLKNLPSEIKRLYQKQKVIFKENWLDPRLHTKRIKELPEFILFGLLADIEFFFILCRR
jgi:mRNA-degrading endonuclease RelE of RelBE toxin-antitoxin system